MPGAAQFLPGGFDFDNPIEFQTSEMGLMRGKREEARNAQK